MKSPLRAIASAAAIASLGVTGCGGEDENGSADEASTTADETSTTAAVPRFSQPTEIDNPYLPISRYGRCVLAGADGDTRIRVVRTLLDRTEPFTVGGERVEVAAVEDREFEDGEIVERTLDYFGQADDGTVHYFGEDVDDYENGKVVGHEGEFRYGRETDTLGVVMPAQPDVGSRWVFEDALPITRESNRVVERMPMATIGDETYEDVIRVREFQEPADEVEFKLYASGFGPVSEGDGEVELVRCE